MLPVLLALAVWHGDAIPAAGQDSEPAGKRWALLIGVDDYAHLNSLTYCGADMLALRDRLIRSGYDDKHVVLLYDKAERAKYRPSRANIETELNLVLAAAEKDDVVLIAFSGHGIYRQGSAYLCPYDAKLEDAETLVSLSKLYQDMQRCPARFKLALVDACRNDPIRGEARTAESRESTLKFAQSVERVPEGIVILNSCSAGQEAKADDSLGHGVFTHFLLEGLGGRADVDRNGSVTLGELFTYAGQETSDHVRLTFSAIQKPKLLGEISPEVLQFSLARTGTRPTPGKPAEASRPKVITNSIGMKLTRIPAGEFMMGTEESNVELQDGLGIAAEDREETYARFDDERPRHRVKIASPFYFGIYEVTKGQFAQFVEATQYKTEAEKDGYGGWGWDHTTDQPVQKPEYTWASWNVTQSDRGPVVNVTYADALEFCSWLSQKESKRYRLPTEAEWEYACRAGTQTWFYCGDDPAVLLQFGNLQDGTAKERFDYLKYFVRGKDGSLFPNAVGQYRPNAFGLYDMHGNVWEWCSDRYSEDYYAASPEEDPQGPDSGPDHVFRGGGWNGVPFCSRSAHRHYSPPTTRHNDIGFRVVLSE